MIPPSPLSLKYAFSQFCQTVFLYWWACIVMVTTYGCLNSDPMFKKSTHEGFCGQPQKNHILFMIKIKVALLISLWNSITVHLYNEYIKGITTKTHIRDDMKSISNIQPLSLPLGDEMVDDNET